MRLFNNPDHHWTPGSHAHRASTANARVTAADGAGRVLWTVCGVSPISRFDPGSLKTKCTPHGSSRLNLCRAESVRRSRRLRRTPSAMMDAAGQNPNSFSQPTRSAPKRPAETIDGGIRFSWADQLGKFRPGTLSRCPSLSMSTISRCSSGSRNTVLQKTIMGAARPFQGIRR